MRRDESQDINTLLDLEESTAAREAAERRQAQLRRRTALGAIVGVVAGVAFEHNREAISHHVFTKRRPVSLGDAGGATFMIERTYQGEFKATTNAEGLGVTNLRLVHVFPDGTTRVLPTTSNFVKIPMDEGQLALGVIATLKGSSVSGDFASPNVMVVAGVSETSSQAVTQVPWTFDFATNAGVLTTPSPVLTID